jgi:hypothetical protein
MRRTVSCLAMSVALGGAALADQVTLPVNQALAVANGLQALSRGSQQVVKDQVLTVPFDLSADVRIAIAKDATRIAEALAPIQKELQAIRETLCPDNACPTDGQAKFDAEANKAGGRTITVDLVLLDQTGLNLDKNTGIGSDILQALSPVATFMK